MSAEQVAAQIVAGWFQGQLTAVEAVVMYFYNVSPIEQVNALFDVPTEAYTAEWVQRYRSGLTGFWGQLDVVHKRRYVQLALALYGDEAARRVGAE